MSLVSHWNQKCGKLPPMHGTEEYYHALLNQAARIQEELDELVDAIKAEDDDEILDALVDIKVTSDGANYLSRHQCVSAFLAVMDNNDLKYSTNREYVENHVLYLAESTGEDYILVAAIFEGKEYYSCHRASDDKIMKLPNHPKVELKSFLFKA